MKFYSSSLERLHFSKMILDKFVKFKYFKIWHAGDPLKMPFEIKRFNNKKIRKK